MSDHSNKNSSSSENLNSSIDIWMIRENQKLSYEERVEQHAKNLELIDELKRFGKAHRLQRLGKAHFKKQKL